MYNRKSLICPLALGLTLVLGASSSRTGRPVTAPVDSSVRTAAESRFLLESVLFQDSADYPIELRSAQDGGDGASPPLTWTKPPKGTQCFAVSIHQWYDALRDASQTPDYYWLLWGLDADARNLSRGNVEQCGVEGGTWDGTGVGFKPPAYTPGIENLHIITVYALSENPASLGFENNANIDWRAFKDAVDGITLGTAELDFFI